MRLLRSRIEVRFLWPQADQERLSRAILVLLRDL
jgi:hypothetical protein